MLALLARMAAGGASALANSRRAGSWELGPATPLGRAAVWGTVGGVRVRSQRPLWSPRCRSCRVGWEVAHLSLHRQGPSQLAGHARCPRTTEALRLAVDGQGCEWVSSLW